MKTASYGSTLPRVDSLLVRDRITRMLNRVLGSNYTHFNRVTANGNLCTTVYFKMPAVNGVIPEYRYYDMQIKIVVMEPYVRMFVGNRWITVFSCSEIEHSLPPFVK